MGRIAVQKRPACTGAHRVLTRWWEQGQCTNLPFRMLAALIRSTTTRHRLVPGHCEAATQQRTHEQFSRYDITGVGVVPQRWALVGRGRHHEAVALATGPSQPCDRTTLNTLTRTNTGSEVLLRRHPITHGQMRGLVGLGVHWGVARTKR